MNQTSFLSITALYGINKQIFYCISFLALMKQKLNDVSHLEIQGEVEVGKVSYFKGMEFYFARIVTSFYVGIKKYRTCSRP